MTTELVVLEPTAFASLAARRVMVELRRVLESQERCSLALAGGSTPRPVYQCLAAEPAGDIWGRVDVFFGDERCVPPTDPASNFRMAREALLDRVPVIPALVHRMEGERADRDAAALAYAAILPARLDLLILGLGDDGHTASLFPDAASLAERGRRVVPVRAPRAPFDRLTITPPVILAARLTVGLVPGADKADALARVIDGPDEPSRTPGQLARGGLWIADAVAASRLEPARR